MAKSTTKSRDIKVVLVTVLVCGIIAGLVFWHFQTVHIAEKRAYLQGATDTLKQIKSIIAK